MSYLNLNNEDTVHKVFGTTEISDSLCPTVEPNDPDIPAGGRPMSVGRPYLVGPAVPGNVR